MYDQANTFFAFALVNVQQRTAQALEDLAAFANTRGGALFIGVEDNGDVVGVADPELEIQRIANTIASRLGLTPSVSRRDAGGREIIEVRVEPARGIIGLNGRYRTRVGSTNRALSPEDLSRLILQRSGQSWDALPSPWALDQVNHSRLECGCMRIRSICGTRAGCRRACGWSNCARQATLRSCATR